MKVFVTRRIPTGAIEPLTEKGWTVDMYDGDKRCPRSELLARSRDADAIVSHGTDVIDSELIEQAGHLKAICSCSIGYDNVDLDSARDHGVIVCNAPAEDLVEATVEAAIALLLSVAKRITRLHIARTLNSLPAYSFSEPMGLAVRGKVTGIVGPGRIGSGIARTMKNGFNNSVLYFGRSAKPVLERQLAARRCELAELFERSDFVFITVPLSSETEQMIGRDELSRLHGDAVLVNVSRAGIVDDAVLVERLSDNRFFGAGLDVYQRVATECTHPNLLLTAHMANGETVATRAVADLAVDNALQVLSGEPPRTPVTAESG